MNFDLLNKVYKSKQDSSSSLLQAASCHSKSSFHQKWNELLDSNSLPSRAWSNAAIEAFLLELSAMDANNFEDTTGVGEREGRICNDIIKRRHFNFAHGMGRSGNLKDPQPKAVGSTILCQLTHKLLRDALRVWGFNRKIMAGGLDILPVCTGMSMMLALLAVRSQFKKVIWLRIDQKSCFKAILGANLNVIVLEGRLDGDEIVTDLEALERVIKEEKAQIHSIVSCVSCFAPRAPDSVHHISQLALKYQIAHIVNAAYGGTSVRACNLLNAAADVNGRIDAVVMSLDKNFMVPVGGAVVFGPDQEMIDRIASRYAGRAGTSHILDLFTSLVGLGKTGVLALKTDRQNCFDYFREELSKVKGLELLLRTPHNDISLALKLPAHIDSFLGSQLFHRNISGARVVEIRGTVSNFEGDLELVNFGSHYSQWTEEFSYINVAAAVGSRQEDIDCFIRKLSRLLE